MIQATKYLKPYQGLKQLAAKILEYIEGHKIPKTLSGIETDDDGELTRENGTPRHKIPKTLSGIETTVCLGGNDLQQATATKYLKPYQGLKHTRTQAT